MFWSSTRNSMGNQPTTNPFLGEPGSVISTDSIKEEEGVFATKNSRKNNVLTTTRMATRRATTHHPLFLFIERTHKKDTIGAITQ